MHRILALILLCFSCTTFAVDRGSIEYFLRDTDVRIVDDQNGTSIVLPSDLLFLKPGDVTMDVEEYEALEEVVDIINDHPKWRLIISAHTDNIPPQPYQYEYSYRQAKQVADYLVAGGVNPKRIEKVVGEGDQWPIASNDTAQGRALNRRVEITLLRKCPCGRDGKRLPPGVEIPEDRYEHQKEREEREEESLGIKGW